MAAGAALSQQREPFGPHPAWPMRNLGTSCTQRERDSCCPTVSRRAREELGSPLFWGCAQWRDPNVGLAQLLCQLLLLRGEAEGQS